MIPENLYKSIDTPMIDTTLTLCTSSFAAVLLDLDHDLKFLEKKLEGHSPPISLNIASTNLRTRKSLRVTLP